MCYKSTSRKGTLSPLTVNLAKITVVLVFFCFAECAAGSCLNYGHACWGAHGKRSGNDNPLSAEDPSGKDFKTKWFISRLVADNLGLDSQARRDMDSQARRDMDYDSKRNPEPSFSGNDKETLKTKFWKTVQDQKDYDEIDAEREYMRRMSPRLLVKRSIKHD